MQQAIPWQLNCNVDMSLVNERNAIPVAVRKSWAIADPIGKLIVASEESV